MSAELPIDRFLHWEANHPEQVYLRQRSGGEFIDLSWAEYGDRVRRLARFLTEQCPEPGSRVAIYAKNCADWFIADMAIMLSGHVSVPLYPGVAKKPMDYILEHAEVKVAFIGLADEMAERLPQLPECIVTVAIGAQTLKCDWDLPRIYAEHERLEEIPKLPGDHVFTLMYTSGTTGHPKGVMHDFNTVAYAVPTFCKMWEMGPTDRFVSYLPLAHAAERIIVEMDSLYCGAVVSFVESQETFVQDLQAIRPTMFFSVPRLWVKFKQGVESRFPPLLLRVLLSVPLLGAKLAMKIRTGLGLDQTTRFVTGSAPTPPEVHRWYRRLGIVLRDGYGMTENFIYGTIAQEAKPLIGAVGSPVGEGEIRIGEGGEVLMRSGALMRGYYRDPERTAKTLQDGWLHTGDKGRIDRNGRLHLTGRVSDTFKTSKGKFIDPGPWEARLGGFAEIDQVLVYGHGLDQPMAIVVLAESAMALPTERLRTLLEGHLQTVNAGHPRYEQIARLGYSKVAWSPQNGMTTPTLKVLRGPLEAKFRPAMLASKTAVVGLD